MKQMIIKLHALSKQAVSRDAAMDVVNFYRAACRELGLDPKIEDPELKVKYDAIFGVP